MVTLYYLYHIEYKSHSKKTKILHFWRIFGYKIAVLRNNDNNNYASRASTGISGTSAGGT